MNVEITTIRKVEEPRVYTWKEIKKFAGKIFKCVPPDYSGARFIPTNNCQVVLCYGSTGFEVANESGWYDTLFIKAEDEKIVLTFP